MAAADRQSIRGRPASNIAFQLHTFASIRYRWVCRRSVVLFLRTSEALAGGVACLATLFLNRGCEPGRHLLVSRLLAYSAEAGSWGFPANARRRRM